MVDDRGPGEWIVCAELERLIAVAQGDAQATDARFHGPKTVRITDAGRLRVGYIPSRVGAAWQPGRARQDPRKGVTPARRTWVSGAGPLLAAAAALANRAADAVRRRLVTEEYWSADMQRTLLL